jgi:type II secretory pathway component PulJ
MTPRCRSGYTLIEALIVMMTLPMLFVIMDKMFREIAVDLPKSSEVVGQHERLLLCLEAVEQDLADAVALPQSFDTWQQDDKTLLIQLPETLVAYVHSATGVTRHTLEPHSEDAKRFWPMSQAHLGWTRLPDASQSNRVEVTTAVLHARRKKLQLKNTRLFYVGVGRAPGGAL